MSASWETRDKDLDRLRSTALFWSLYIIPFVQTMEIVSPDLHSSHCVPLFA